MKKFWNERYASERYAYGVEPNGFFKAWIDTQEPGTILFPGEGEGRNAVYAARKGWDVYAFDYSESGRDKALSLAEKHGVSINFEVADASEYKPSVKFDAIVLVYAHFPPPVREAFHRKAVHWLKPEGYLVLQAYNKQQIKNGTGGPKAPEMLLDKATVEHEFKGLNFLSLENKTLHIEEGLYHNGISDVIRLIAQKEK